MVRPLSAPSSRMHVHTVRQRRALMVIVCACVVTIWVLHRTASESLLALKQTAFKAFEKDDFRPPRPETRPLHWHVNESSRNRAEEHHIIFLKTHKAASTTIRNILLRFSVSRQLNVLFPYDGHILSQTSPEMNKVMDHPPSPPFYFDILCNHVVFRRETVSRYFPPDSVYVTILRQPLNQVYSAYDYYRNSVYHDEYLMRAANFTDFLTNQDKYEPANPYISYTNNRMSLDLGLPPEHIHNASYLTTFLQFMADNVDLVLIVERFDESMVMMKRRFKWTTKDVLYVNHNSNPGNVTTTVFDLDPAVEVIFRWFNQFDVGLYEHYSKVFDQLVRSEGQDFQEEVRSFVSILQQVQQFCSVFTNLKELVIPQNKWNDQFVVRSEECDSINLHEVFIDRRILYWQKKRMGVLVKH